MNQGTAKRMVVKSIESGQQQYGFKDAARWLLQVRGEGLGVSGVRVWCR